MANTSKEAAATTNGATKQPLEEVKEILTKPADKPAAKSEKPQTDFTIIPLSDRLHRLNVLFDLQMKYNKLQDTLAKLKAFQIKADKEDSELTIEDGNRNSFATTNSEVIEKVIWHLIETVQTKIKQLENQLTW